MEEKSLDLMFELESIKNLDKDIGNDNKDDELDRYKSMLSFKYKFQFFLDKVKYYFTTKKYKIDINNV